MTENKLTRANRLFYGIEEINDIEKKLWSIFEGDHNDEFKQISEALFKVRAKFLKEFEEMKCD